MYPREICTIASSEFAESSIASSESVDSRTCEKSVQLAKNLVLTALFAEIRYYTATDAFVFATNKNITCEKPSANASKWMSVVEPEVSALRCAIS